MRFCPISSSADIPTLKGTSSLLEPSTLNYNHMHTVKLQIQGLQIARRVPSNQCSRWKCSSLSFSRYLSSLFWCLLRCPVSVSLQPAVQPVPSRLNSGCVSQASALVCPPMWLYILSAFYLGLRRLYVLFTWRLALSKYFRCIFSFFMRYGQRWKAETATYRKFTRNSLSLQCALFRSVTLSKRYPEYLWCCFCMNINPLAECVNQYLVLA